MDFGEKIFRDRKNFLRIALKSISSDFQPKQTPHPDFDFSKKIRFSMKKFLKIQKSQKIALKSISIEIEQFMAFFGSIKPLRVINNRSELLNAVLNHLKPFKDLLEPFRVL